MESLLMNKRNPTATEIAQFIFRPYFLKDNLRYMLLWGIIIHGFSGVCIFYILGWEKPLDLDNRLACTLVNVGWGFFNSILLMVVILPYLYLKIWGRSRLVFRDHFIFVTLLVLTETVRFYFTNTYIYDFGISFIDSLGYVLSFSSGLIIFNFLLVLSTVDPPSEATTTTDQTPRIITLGKGTKEMLRLSEDRLLVVTAAGNYSEVYWTNSSGLREKTLFPVTLGGIETQLQNYPQFYRCHKSFVINVKLVEQFCGNARETTVNIRQFTTKIPVARNKIVTLKEMLKRFDVETSFSVS